MSDVDSATPPDPEAEKFYEGAYGRITKIMVVVGAAASLAAAIRFGWRVGAGVASGCVLAGVNFLWMKRAIMAFAGRLTASQAADSVRGSATRFLARYGVIAAVAYVIFKSSIVSLSGVLVGLFLPVAAILAEAVYETYVALRRGL